MLHKEQYYILELCSFSTYKNNRLALYPTGTDYYSQLCYDEDDYDHQPEQKKYFAKNLLLSGICAAELAILRSSTQ